MAGRGQYTSGFPLQDVRLRNWPAGKVGALKRAVSMLEDQLNQTMAAQVNQGGKRVFNSSIPKVVNLAVTAGFKNFQLTFDPAKGIDNLLFYEIQKDTTSSFSNPTTYTIPQTTLTIPSTAENQTTFFRVRVLNSKFECGPWSNDTSATSSSSFRISVTRSGRHTVELPFSNLDTWNDIYSVTYTPTAAAISINVHAGVYAQVTKEFNSANTVVYQNGFDVYFRVLKDGVAITNAGGFEVAVSASYGHRTGGGPSEIRSEMAEFMTLVTPFETFLGQESPATYTLQAMISTANGASYETATSGAASADPVVVIVDSFDILQIFQSF